MYDISDQKVENYFVKSMYSCYADILFIALPFVVICFLRGWNIDDFNFLEQPDIAVATCILSGMSIGRIVQSLVSNQHLADYKVKFTFFIAMILFFLVGPSLIHIMQTVEQAESDSYLLFAQPVLLVAAIAIYSISFNISYLVTKLSEIQRGQEPWQDLD